MSLDGLLTTAEATRRAERSRRTIERWVAAGLLVPAYRFPGRTGAYLFRPEDIDAAKAAATERAS